MISEFEYPYFRSSMSIIFLLNTSEAMEGEKIAAVNKAMPEIFSSLTRLQDELEITIPIRVISFSHSAQWVVGSDKTGIMPEQLLPGEWEELSVVPGGSNLGAAATLARRCMRIACLGPASYYPLVVLVTDGYSSSAYQEDMQAIDALRKSLAPRDCPDKEKVRCIAISLSQEGLKELEHFASSHTLVNTTDESCVFETVPWVYHPETPGNLTELLECTITEVLYSATGIFRIPPFTDDNSTSYYSEDTWDD